MWVTTKAETRAPPLVERRPCSVGTSSSNEKHCKGLDHARRKLLSVMTIHLVLARTSWCSLTTYGRTDLRLQVQATSRVSQNVSGQFQACPCGENSAAEPRRILANTSLQDVKSCQHVESSWSHPWSHPCVHSEQLPRLQDSSRPSRPLSAPGFCPGHLRHRPSGHLSLTGELVRQARLCGTAVTTLVRIRLLLR